MKNRHSSLDQIIGYWPLKARDRHAQLTFKYIDSGIDPDEAQWKAFLAIKEDLKRWESLNPDKVDLAYADLEFPSEDDFLSEPQRVGNILVYGLINGHRFDEHKQYHIEDGRKFVADNKALEERSKVLPYPRDVDAEIAATRKKLESIPKMKLEVKAASKPKREPKAEKPKPVAKAKRSKHDPNAGNLFS